MEDDLKKNEMEDDLNFEAVIIILFNNKTSKTNGFDTIEIELVFVHFYLFRYIISKNKMISFSLLHSWHR